MKSLDAARALARTMVDLCKAVGRDCVALLTPMDVPLGSAVGNAVEVAESIEVLHGRGPQDVRELTLELGVEMLLAGRAPGVEAGQPGDRGRARAKLERALADGSAARRFAQLIEAQGGDPRVVDEPGRLPRPKLVREVRTGLSGYLLGLDAELVGLAAVELGAGRARKEDPVDPAAGLLLLRRPGQAVRPGDVIAELHGATEARLDAGERRLRAAIAVGEQPPQPTPAVLERIA
jgi:thymidine phosphorylase